MYIYLIELVNLFCAGMLAGIEFVIHYGWRVPSEALDGKPRIQLRQALILKLRWIVPAFFVPMALSGIAVTLWGGAGRDFGLRCAAMLAVVSWIFVRVVGTVRINEATLTWHADAPPENWQEQIRKAERFHVVGTWAAVIAFVCFLVAATPNPRL
jgi:hypothetical protein